MNWRSLILVTAVLTFLTASTPSVFAGGYWRFYISVDGKPAFTGGSGVFGDFSPLDHLETSVRGGVQLGDDSFLGENAAGDITLIGDVVFRDQQHPPLHMKRLRLVYEKHMADRTSGATVAGGYYDWRLHPEDAAFIVAHYRKDANIAVASRLAKVVAALLVASALTVVFMLWRRRRRRNGQNELLGLTTATIGSTGAAGLAASGINVGGPRPG